MTPKHNTEAAPHNGFSLISNERLLALYRAMVETDLLARRFGPAWALEPGADAVLAGVLLTLEPRDLVKSWRKRPLAAHIRGASPAQTLRANKSFASPAAASLQALQAARKVKAEGKSAAVVALLDGEPEAHWTAAFEAAAKEALPLLFVAETREHEDEPGLFVNHLAGVPLIPVDRADAVAVYRVATECVAHARRGYGPSLIECRSIPGSSPLERMAAYLDRKGLFRPGAPRSIASALGQALRRASHSTGA